MECSICLEKTQCQESQESQNICKLSCHHEFHINCITKWYAYSASNTCPICRKNENIDNFIIHIFPHMYDHEYEREQQLQHDNTFSYTNNLYVYCIMGIAIFWLYFFYHW